ncbi:MAG: nucleotide exchange factor GrpE [Candidatus Dormibacteraeota bacterium]|nr:nucleotide exchange factor GrpE [Candidatus Dormibacteraeota bacterium]
MKQQMPGKERPPDRSDEFELPSRETMDQRASASAPTEADLDATATEADPDAAAQAAREEAEASFARYQRLAADFENYKRRTRQELADRTQYANEELLRKLLPILDNFRRALHHTPPDLDPQWLEGIKLVARQFEAALAAQGLTTIPALGEKFDPSQHQAIASQETDEQEEGTIVEEMQAGYRLHDRVLRPTLVKVAQPPALNS